MGEELCGGSWEKFEGCIESAYNISLYPHPKFLKIRKILLKRRQIRVVNSSSKFKIRKLAAKTEVARIDHEFNFSFRKFMVCRMNIIL